MPAESPTRITSAPAVSTCLADGKSYAVITVIFLPSACFLDSDRVVTLFTAWLFGLDPVPYTEPSGSLSHAAADDEDDEWRATSEGVNLASKESLSRKQAAATGRGRPSPSGAGDGVEALAIDGAPNPAARRSAREAMPTQGPATIISLLCCQNVRHVAKSSEKKNITLARKTVRGRGTGKDEEEALE